MELLNDGHIGDEHFVHCSEIVPSSEVVMYGNIQAGGEQCNIVGRLSTHRSVHYQRFLGLPRYTFNCPACATITRRITYTVAGKA